MEFDETSKKDRRAVELSFRKATNQLTKEEEEELKRVQATNALKRRAKTFSDTSDGDSA